MRSNQNLEGLPQKWLLVKIAEVMDRLPPGPLHDTSSNQQTGKVPIISQSEDGFAGYHDGPPGIVASSENPIVTFANHTCAVRWHESHFSTIQNVFPLRGKPGVMETEFLYWILKWAIKPTFYGGHWPILIKKLVPLPPLHDQKVIAGRLKDQLAEVQVARHAVETQLQDAVYFANLYGEITLDLLNNAPRVALGELLKGIEAGKSFKTSELPARPEQLGVLKVSAVSWNKFQPQEAKVIEDDYQPDDRHRVKKGDLIISRANTKELVGAVVMSSKDYPLRLLSDKTLRLLVDEEQVLPAYLLNVLKWPEARAYIENNATGTSDSMRNISQKTICRIPIPMIPKEMQLKIVDRFNAVAEEVQGIEVAIKKIYSDINQLPQKILAHAFEM